MCPCAILTRRFFIHVLLYERHRGLVIRALACGAEGPRSKSPSIGGVENSSLFTQQLMGTQLSSELGKVQVVKREEVGNSSHAVPSDTCGTLTFTAATTNRLWDISLHLLFFTLCTNCSRCSMQVTHTPNISNSSKITQNLCPMPKKKAKLKRECQI